MTHPTPGPVATSAARAPRAGQIGTTCWSEGFSPIKRHTIGRPTPSHLPVLRLKTSVRAMWREQSRHASYPLGLHAGSNKQQRTTVEETLKRQGAHSDRMQPGRFSSSSRLELGFSFPGEKADPT